MWPKTICLVKYGIQITIENQYLNKEFSTNEH